MRMPTLQPFPFVAKAALTSDFGKASPESALCWWQFVVPAVLADFPKILS